MKQFILGASVGFLIAAAGWGGVHLLRHRPDITVSADPITPDPVHDLAIHEAILERNRRAPVGVVFLGDSITSFWMHLPWEWDRLSKFQPSNAGIAWNQTQNVLWGIEHGELDGIAPKVVVLLIGTNNLRDGHDTPEQTAEGVRRVVEVIRPCLPTARILLLDLFPRADAFGPSIAPTNRLLREIPGVEHVSVGITTADLVSDGLHLSPAGYHKWTDAMLPTLERLYGADNAISK